MRIELYDDKGVQLDEIEVSREWVAKEAMEAARQVVLTTR